MKLKRTREKYGLGSGSRFFKSDMFCVNLWKMSEGTKTVLECLLWDDLGNRHEITFDGDQTKHLYSDVFCLKQLNCAEIMKIIKYQRKLGFEEGKNHKIKEIVKCLSYED